MALDYSLLDKAIEELGTASTTVLELEKKLNENTLESDVGAMSSLNSNYLSELKNDIDSTKTSLENGKKDLSRIRNAVIEGKLWN